MSWRSASFVASRLAQYAAGSQLRSSEQVQMRSESEKKVVLSCAGVAVRGVMVPSFEVHRGHIVTVRLPIADDRIGDDLAQLLVGVPPMESIGVFEKVVVAKLPIERRQRMLMSRIEIDASISAQSIPRRSRREMVVI